MKDKNTFIKASQVAEMIGYNSATAFLNARLRLQGENGFPMPMPTSQSPLIWRKSQIRSWIESTGIPKQFAIEATGNVVLLREAATA